MREEHPSYYDEYEDERLLEEYEIWREQQLAEDEDQLVMDYESWSEYQLAKIAEFMDENDRMEDCI